MTDKPDTTTLSGAEFQRYAGTDPVKWAEALLCPRGVASGWLDTRPHRR